MVIHFSIQNVFSPYDLRMAWARLDDARQAGLLASEEVVPALRVIEEMLEMVESGTPPELRPPE